MEAGPVACPLLPPVAPAQPELVRRLPSWHETACDRCGAEHQATRAQPRDLAPGEELLCSDCVSYDAGARQERASLETDVRKALDARWALLVRCRVLLGALYAVECAGRVRGHYALQRHHLGDVAALAVAIDIEGETADPLTGSRPEPPLPPRIHDHPERLPAGVCADCLGDLPHALPSMPIPPVEHPGVLDDEDTWSEEVEVAAGAVAEDLLGIERAR